MNNRHSYFFIRTSAGVITGPFPISRLDAMKANGRLKEGDCISADRRNWINPFSVNETPEEVLTVSTPPHPLEAPLQLSAMPSSNIPLDTGDMVQKNISEPASESLSPILQDNSATASDDSESRLRWGTIIASIWTGGFHFPEITLARRKAAAWIIPYSFLCCVLPWIFLPLQPTVRGRLACAGIGIVAFLFYALVSFLVPVIVSWCSWKKYIRRSEDDVMVIYSICSSCMAYGTVVLLRNFVTLHGLMFWIPAIILPVVLIWVFIMLGMMVQTLVIKKLQATFSWWGIPICLTTIIFLELPISTIFFLGGHQ